MFSHQAGGQHAHGDAPAGVGDEAQEGGVVALGVKDSGPSVAPVEDVVDEVAGRSPGGARHGGEG